MRIEDALKQFPRVFFDTAPIVSYLENHPQYHRHVERFFESVDAGTTQGVVSPVSLAECLVHPMRRGLVREADAFSRLLLASVSMTFATLGAQDAIKAAEIRARYNLPLMDSFQVAVALARVALPC